MYPQRRMARQALALRLGLLVTLVVVALSACGGGGAKDSSEEAATMKTVAGDGGEQLGDGGPATAAGFYCSGPGGHTVRKVDPNGTITTVAGTGEEGYSGDGGPATKARLNLPIAVEVDREGNLYITDENNYRIRKVDKDGIITTVAGTAKGAGKKGRSADGGPATSAQLRDPGDMTFDARGNMYLGDYLTVRKIDPSGTITTVAGTGQFGFSGDGGPATEAKLTVGDVALDGEGNMYISDTENQRIRKVDKNGIITTVAGSGDKGYSGDGGPAIKAALNLPVGLAVDGEGNLFFADHHNNVVRKIDPQGNITTVAGTGTDELVSIREKGPARKVMLDQPWGLFLDEDSGVLYIADAFNARIRALRLEGE
jgi:sugar lactone lactonase YvrE